MGINMKKYIYMLWNTSLRHVVQRCPAVPTAANTTERTASWISASSITMIALFPLNSSKHFPYLSFTVCWTIKPTCWASMNLIEDFSHMMEYYENRTAKWTQEKKIGKRQCIRSKYLFFKKNQHRSSMKKIKDGSKYLRTSSEWNQRYTSIFCYRLTNCSAATKWSENSTW